MNFFKVFWAALLGCLVSGIVGFFIWVAVIFSALGSLGSAKPIDVTAQSILKIELGEIFTDAPQRDPLSQIDFATMEIIPSISLLNALVALEWAESDDNIEGIFLKISPYANLSLASLEELRAALKKFKESGKFIVAYNDTYTQTAYYLSTVADSIYAQPEGTMMWQGMASNTIFYKGLLDKLNISVDVFRPTACRFKSAVEPFILDKMSKENRSQMQELLDSMWERVASDVALARGLTLEQVNQIADDLSCMDVDDALSCRMIDGLIYEDQLPAIFRSLASDIPARDQDINYIDFADYVTLYGTPLSHYNAPKIAIIYAEGNIVDGEGIDAKVYGDSTAEIIRSARNDDSIEAVVLRVNSPGGSALASDVMWRELELLREQKPLIVSMGGYAASGGYYISAPADVIIANELTLTGSIGVFGMIPNIERGLKTKLGLTIDGVETNRSSDFLTSLSGMSAGEKAVMLKSVDKVYEHFTELVSNGRNLPIEKVLEIAQGRVWSGSQAKELGLVDLNGGLHDAISVAVSKAGIEDDFRIVELTGEPTGFSALFYGIEARIKAAVTAKADPIEKQYHQIIRALEPLECHHGLIMYSPYSVCL